MSKEYYTIGFTKKKIVQGLKRTCYKQVRILWYYYTAPLFYAKLAELLPSCCQLRLV